MTKKDQIDPNTLNSDPDVRIGWFDDLGSGNEQFRFLSNFYEGEPFKVGGFPLRNGQWLPDETDKTKVMYKYHRTTGISQAFEWMTGEHAFQAAKFLSLPDFSWIADAPTPSEAKARGRSRNIPLREDWEKVKYDVMMAVLRGKFTKDREEGKRLLDTNDALLVEGTFWHDRVWGVDAAHGPLAGRNWLGTLLMARRAELRAEALGATIHTPIQSAMFAFPLDKR